MGRQPGQLLCFAYVHDGRWVAVCPDLDITVRGDSRAEAKRRLKRELIDYLDRIARAWRERGYAGAAALYGAPVSLARRIGFALEAGMARLSLFDPDRHQMYLERDPTVLVA